MTSPAEGEKDAATVQASGNRRVVKHYPRGSIFGEMVEELAEVRTMPESRRTSTSTGMHANATDSGSLKRSYASIANHDAETVTLASTSEDAHGGGAQYLRPSRPSLLGISIPSPTLLTHVEQTPLLGDGFGDVEEGAADSEPAGPVEDSAENVIQETLRNRGEQGSRAEEETGRLTDSHVVGLPGSDESLHASTIDISSPFYAASVVDSVLLSSSASPSLHRHPDLFSLSDDTHSTTRNDILHEILAEQVIDSDNYQLISILSGTSMPYARSHSKPPVPTSPKPLFSRRPLSQDCTPLHSPMASTLVFEGYTQAPPPTTNWLNQDERADLVRKSRKLTRLFGRTPGADIMAYQENPRSSSSQQQAMSGMQRHQRTPLSLSNDLDNSISQRQRRSSAWPASPTDTLFSGTSSENRRHSLPISKDEVTFLNPTSPLYDAGLSLVASRSRQESSEEKANTSAGKNASTDQTPSSALQVPASRRSSSPSHTSFIDWSDEEGPDDGLSIISQEPPTKPGRNRRPVSPTNSLFENLTPEEQAEEEKRRKRERLAKLHRFLGSTVPVGLVVGFDSTGEPVQPTSTAPVVGRSMPEGWTRRRRSSSSAALPSWGSDFERMKEELDSQEKLINVRRAQKMEKVRSDRLLASILN